MKSCDNCGSNVTDDYFRVLNVDGELKTCPSCGNQKGNDHNPNELPNVEDGGDDDAPPTAKVMITQVSGEE